MVDLANLEWWQSFVGIIALLGLSPAPWLLGLATGRLQFASPAQKNHESQIKALQEQFTARVTDLKEAHRADIVELVDHHDKINCIQVERYAEMKESRDGWKEATSVERERANIATAAVSEVLTVVKATNHVLSSLQEVITPPTPQDEEVVS